MATDVSNPSSSGEFVAIQSVATAARLNVRSLVDQAVARFGRLDVAVNNAGTEMSNRR